MARVFIVYGIYLSVVHFKLLNYKIYDIDFKKTQGKRERYQHFTGSIIDSAFIFLMVLAGVFHFISSLSMMELVIYSLTHVFIVEPLYYWYHRLLHIGKFYKKHHIYHHWSIIPSPLTSFTFTFLERLSYSVLFAIPLFIASILGYLSITGLFIYIIVFDFCNSIGHFNYEIFPKKYGELKVRWLFYTPTYHAQHHTRFHYNFALFMPIYDKLFGTYLPDTDNVFKEVCERNPQKKTRPSFKHLDEAAMKK